MNGKVVLKNAFRLCVILKLYFFHVTASVIIFIYIICSIYVVSEAKTNWLLV